MVGVQSLARSKCHPRKGQRFTADGSKYEFLGALGDGAVGLVRKARDLASGRIVAVKVLAPDPKYIDIAAFDDVAQRFRREGTRGANLRDDNLVEIIAYEDNEDGSCFGGGGLKNPFIIMEYVRGGTGFVLSTRSSTYNATDIVPCQPHLSGIALLTRQEDHSQGCQTRKCISLFDVRRQYPF